MSKQKGENDVDLRYARAGVTSTKLEMVVDGEVVEEFDVHPSLAELREAQQEYAPRFDLYDAGLHCPTCQSVIDEDTRFGKYRDKILCKECADIQAVESPAQSNLSVTNDPTQTVLGKSDLYNKRLVDYNVNVATGCSHGCSFCYVPATPQIRTQQQRLKDSAGVEDSAAEWGEYLLHRDDAPERLRRQLERWSNRGFDGWQRTEEGRGIVGLSFHTDCYQSRRAADATRGCIRELIHHDRYVRVLTRSPIVTRDIDLFQEAGEKITVGMSIPSLDDAALRSIETSAPPPTARLNALREVSDAGVQTFVSMGPTLPTQNKDDLRELLEHLSTLNPGVIFHEPLNPKGPNFDRTVAAARENGQEELADAIDELSDDRTWREYAFEQIRWVHQLGRELELPVYCWPDKSLKTGMYAEYAEWWMKQESPERFAGRSPVWDVPPEIPNSAPKPQAELGDF